MVKIGIIGGGHIVKHRHIPAFQKIKDAEIIGICDKDESIAQKVAKKFNIRNYYTNLSDMLKQKPDVVDICSPPKSHLSLGLEAIENGCHVLMEKPLVMTGNEADRLYNAARAQDVTLCVVHQNLYNPTVMHAKSLIENGDVGEILSIEAGTMVRKENYMCSDGNHWCHKLPGGIFFELLPHPIYLLQMFLKDLHVRSTLAKKKGSYDWIKADELRVLLDNDSIIGTIISSCNSPFHGDTLNIFGTKMYLQVDLWGRSIIRFKGRTQAPYSVGKANLEYAGQCLGLLGTTVSNSSTMALGGIKVSAHYGFLDAYVRAIKQNSELPVTEKDAKDNVRLVEEICSQIEKTLSE